MKKLIAALAVSAVFILSACGNKNESSSAVASEPTDGPASEAQTVDPGDSSEAASKDRLPFIDSGEIYFDINVASGVFDDLKIKLGDQEITGSGKVKFNGTDKPVVEGKGNGSEIHVAIYNHDSNGDFVDAVIATGDLQKALEIDLRTYSKGKSYILITDKADGFDHSLDPSLTEYLSEWVKD